MLELRARRIAARCKQLAVTRELRGHDLADLEHRIGVLALDLLNADRTGGLDVELAARVLDLDDDVAVGLDLRHRTAEKRRARDFECVGRQGNRPEIFGLLVGGGITEADGAAQAQRAGGLDVHHGLVGAGERGNRDRPVGAQTVRVEVLQAGDRGLDGGDHRLAQPAATGLGRALDGDFLVGEVAVQAVFGFLGRPVAAIGALDALALGRLEHLGPLGRVSRVGRHAGRVVDQASASHLLDELPLGGIAEVFDGEGHGARVAHPHVQLVGGNVSHQRFVFEHLHRRIALAHVGHDQRCAAVGRRDFFRFQQGGAVGELALDVFGLGVRREKVPIEPDQVEAAFFIGVDLGLGHCLALGPGVVATRDRLVKDGLVTGRAHSGIDAVLS